MAGEITHFIWGYQRHYRARLQVAACAIFALLDSRFDPQVFLVGLRLPGRTGRFSACVEPEDDFWIDSDAFSDTLANALPRVARYPESALLHSHPVAQQHQDEYLLRRAIQDEIRSILAEHAGATTDLEHFVSHPEVVGDFAVSVVLGLQGSVLRQHYRLTQDRADLHESRSYQVARSLSDAATGEFFQDATEELRKSEPGYPSPSRRSAEEVLRAAGRQLMYDSALRADRNTIEGWHNLFGTCHVLSSMKYERGVGSGELVVAAREHPHLTRHVTFGEAPRLENLRGTRKLLELTSTKLALHSNSESLFGLVEVSNYPSHREDLFQVRFIGDCHWELAHASQTLMRVKYGQPYLPLPQVYAAKLAIDLRRIFKPMADRNVELIVRLVQAAENEAHGTTLLISANAEAEARRLQNPGIIVDPIVMTPELLGRLSRIDGAVILDPLGRCHAVGVILDGSASGSGNPARGARYNSAVRYVQSSKSSKVSSLAVILSDDGGVDLVPDLRPPIDRALIDRAVQELRGVAERSVIPLRRYNNVYDWLRGHQFYLREDDCGTINALIAEVEGRMDREDPYRFKLVHSPLVANSELDEEFYYEPEAQHISGSGGGNHEMGRGLVR